MISKRSARFPIFFIVLALLIIALGIGTRLTLNSTQLPTLGDELLTADSGPSQEQSSELQSKDGNAAFIASSADNLFAPGGPFTTDLVGQLPSSATAPPFENWVSVNNNSAAFALVLDDILAPDGIFTTASVDRLPSSATAPPFENWVLLINDSAAIVPTAEDILGPGGMFTTEMVDYSLALTTVLALENWVTTGTIE